MVQTLKVNEFIQKLGRLVQQARTGELKNDPSNEMILLLSILNTTSNYCIQQYMV
jgi:hypothetical protein